MVPLPWGRSRSSHRVVLGGAQHRLGCPLLLSPSSLTVPLPPCFSSRSFTLLWPVNRHHLRLSRILARLVIAAYCPEASDQGKKEKLKAPGGPLTSHTLPTPAPTPAPAAYLVPTYLPALVCTLLCAALLTSPVRYVTPFFHLSPLTFLLLRILQTKGKTDIFENNSPPFPLPYTDSCRLINRRHGHGNRPHRARAPCAVPHH